MQCTEELKHEHQAVLKALAILEKVGRALEEGQTGTLDDAGRVMEFLTVFVDRCHHGKEENILFPALVQAGVPGEGGPVGVMLTEHDEGRRYIRDMKDALTALTGGRREKAASFVAAARNYAELLREHIEKEDNVLYPLADHLLPLGTDEEMAREFQRIENEKVGAGKHEEFHRMLHELDELYR
jgi:hemerythrin-like domain-containing protein